MSTSMQGLGLRWPKRLLRPHTQLSVRFPCGDVIGGQGRKDEHHFGVTLQFSHANPAPAEGPPATFVMLPEPLAPEALTTKKVPIHCLKERGFRSSAQSTPVCAHGGLYC